VERLIATIVQRYADHFPGGSALLRKRDEERLVQETQAVGARASGGVAADESQPGGGDGLHRRRSGDSRMVRILSVVDVYTRECLPLEADVGLCRGRVTRVLERLIAPRGRP
jgi:hypothetical protein